MKDLKQRTMRGGLARIVSQITTLLLRTGTLMIMARLLLPKDFGLVGMVTAVIGVFSVFRDFGLSAAAVQRQSITTDQSSTLFWINVAVGLALGLIAIALGPFIAAFYHEPHLAGVTAVLATAFVFNACGVQHSALLERQMRFVMLSIIDIVSLAVSTSIGIGMALRGFGYWSLVATSTVTPLVYTIGVWFATRWVPGRPRKHLEIFHMMRFGGTLTLSGLIMYFAMNLDKVLLGRFWGVDALGIYGRAYQLVNIPTDNLNSAAGGVVFAALSRLQDQPARLRNFFLKGYSLVLSLTVPIAMMCGLFGDDIIHVFLGPKWNSAVPIFRLLAPTTLGFAILSPLGWLLSSCGLVGRGLRIAFVLAPILFAGYAVGLHWGPMGVATAYSTVMMLAVIPLIAWARSGTPVLLSDLLLSIGRPILSGVVAGAVAFTPRLLWGSMFSPLPRLVLAGGILVCVYLGMLLGVLKQKQLYVDILRGFFKPPSTDEVVAVSA
ncbi:MAG TPA: lipopolysaccharide biosynthesis protein [Acidobacteriaceae bacterium]|jgi:PST family polysaccharide transporter